MTSVKSTGRLGARLHGGQEVVEVAVTVATTSTCAATGLSC